MENQPPKKSRTMWWILGSVAIFSVAGGILGNLNTQTPSAAVSPSSQTADVAQRVVQPVTTPIEPITQPQPTAQPQGEPEVQPTSQPVTQPQPATLSNDNYYTNSDGNTVHSPANSNTVPAGASAKCRDGTYSFSKHHSGTCSGHGGVATWL